MKKRITALLLAVVSILSMLTAPASAAAPDTIKMDDCAYSGTKYDSPALGECYMHQMHFALNGKSTMGFCAEKGKGMGWSLKGHTWGNPKPISDPTVKTMMAYFYAHSTGVFTDQAKALGVDDVWDSNYTWTMNSWTQAVVWRYKAGLLSDPVVACAEELLCVYNNLEHTSYTSIDDTMDGRSFRDRAQYILDLGAQGVWGECSVYEYAYTGPGSNYHPANDVQAVMVGELNITRQKYELTVKKVDSTNPNKGLAGARFIVSSENGAFSKEIVTGQDGTYTLTALDAGTYAVTELEAPEGYEIDNAGPQYVVLPSNGNNTVTVTFADSPEITGEGSIRKVDADDPTKGLAGAVIKITGVDNDFTGTYVTGTGGYLTDVPWKDMPLGSYTAEAVTPPEGYTKSPEVNKTKQTFRWDGKTDMSFLASRPRCTCRRIERPAQKCNLLNLPRLLRHPLRSPCRCSLRSYRAACVSFSASASSSSLSVSSTLPRTSSFSSPLITSSFSCTIFSDMVCSLLSEWCVATSFYQSAANYVSFYFCETYSTLSLLQGTMQNFHSLIQPFYGNLARSGGLSNSAEGHGGTEHLTAQAADHTGR